jgi:two-component system, OmpR family, sensor kinase
VTSNDDAGSGRGPGRVRTGGFRLRVLGFTAGILAVAISVALVAQRTILLEQLDDAVEATLEQERQELESLAGGLDPSTGEPFGGDVEAIFRVYMERNVPVRDEMYLALVDGEPFLATRPAPIELAELTDFVRRVGILETGERGTLETDQGQVRYLAIPLAADDGPRGVFVVAQLLTRDRQQIDDNTRAAAIAAGVILVVTTFFAWLLAGRLLRPVRDLTETARTITEEDLSRRIPAKGDDEIAELARTFNEMLDRLAAGFEDQRSFIDDAGHELRTPITVIRGQLEVMGDDPDERREVMAIVDTELDRMSRIVEDLLLLAKAEQGDFVHAEPVELSDFTTELFVKAQALGDRDWHFDACAEGEAVLDPQRVTQAALNLARNAVEHGPADGRISIGSEIEGTTLKLYVHDSGPAIGPDDRERIFERFSRGSRRRSRDGAGLGLSIVRAIAEAHGGRAHLEHDERGGNRFVIELPGAVGNGGSGAARAGTGAPPLEERTTEVTT